MFTTRRTIGFTALAIAGLQFACIDNSVLLEDVPPDQANERISIINDEAVLAARMTILDEVIAIEPASAEAPARLVLGGGVTLTLIAEAVPPTVGGQLVQATAVALSVNKAVVSYSMVGEPHLGGIDVFNIPNGNQALLKSEATFNDSDIHAVTFDDGNVYAAAATDAAGFATPAVFEIMELQGVNLVLDNNQRTDLPSFAATSVVVSSTRIYATSGNTGGLSVFDRDTLALVSSIDLLDARWVAVDGGKVVVVQGTPGQITVLDEATLAILGTYSFPGADVAESKSTVEVVGGKAFIAAGTAGVQILSVETGTIVGSIARPDPASLGLDASVVVTNAVSVDNDLLFISNGEAGVYLAQADQPFADTGSDAPQNITLLGQLRFDDLQSVNHVAYRGNLLFIAAGSGGLKIVRVE